MRLVEAVKPRVSFTDLQRMPEDGNRYELYDGELRVVPSPLPIHEIVKRRLFERLIGYSAVHGGEVFDAPFDIVLSEYDVVQPDILYFAPASARRIRLREHVRFAPDLAIEVVSPSTARADRTFKRRLLERYRVPGYWVVDPDAQRIEVSTLVASRYDGPRMIAGARFEPAALPGLTIDLDELFVGLD